MAPYDAFVSYSHAKDKPIAAALQSVIQRLGKAWYQRRALRVFRDDTSLTATPSLWPSIEQALLNSRFLILLASPEAAASPWVNKEISWWLDNKSGETILIALTDGELAWDNAIGDFVWRAGMSLPPVMTGRFTTEPKWIDLRPYRDGANPRDARFIEAGADFAAAIHTPPIPKEDLLSHEVRQQRRALIMAWSAASSLLILVAVAGWQWKVAIDNERAAIAERNVAEEQRRVAQEQRDRAERTLTAATETANTLVFDLAREFRDRTGMPRDLVRRIVDRAWALQKQLLESGETAPALRHSEAITLADLAETLIALGDTKGALEAALRMRMLMEGLVAIHPDNEQWQRDLAVSSHKIGDVLLAGGRREEALTEYRRGLTITEKLAAASPGSMRRQLDLSGSLDLIGDTLVALGRPEEALDEFRRSLTIRVRLTDSDHGNVELQRNTAASYQRIGDILAAAGQREEALAEYRQSLARLQKLTAQDTGNALWQRDLSVMHGRIADMLSTSGQREEALAEYRLSLKIRMKIAATDPGNVQWQRDLSVIYGKIGNMLLSAARRKEALMEYDRSLAIAEKLAAADPNNKRWQTDLVISLYNVSTAAEAPQARGALFRAIEIADMLAKLGALTGAQRDWPQALRSLFAKLPPETADAR